ncbi:NAD(P)-dependent alcohol dehydrogenase [Phenylobacterium sp.]|uniref:NAD(P)-dependent alcohol dehydrogenase n=1 Tax=Phenylobacterium sp. TaxID=1871053 RepID=UPI00121ADEEE|nr:NAD(P)-dependent alcohol dehydrogenase [Phenylobacterium sp.]TAL30890.1 MAG: NAD(P)-dependent alcohol dehydrogenase [Phenylobacterium sp.]
MSTMRALAVDAARQASFIVEAPIPTPRPGQILVEVKVAGVNEMDVEVRKGGWAGQVKRFRKDGPVLTGFELAGIARTDGRRIRAGQRVIGYSPVLNGPRCHAEFAIIDERALLAIPATLSDEAGAALTVMGLTAIEVLEHICPATAGQRCLIIGAAGGFGAYAVQLAARQGREVTAVASAANAAWVLAQGAAAVRPYETEPATQPDDAYDLIIDTPARLSFREAETFLSRRGMYVSSNPTADLAGFARAALSSRRAGYLMMLKTDPRRLGRLAALADEGALRPVVDSVFPLEEADAAFDRFETRGKQGRVLLRL